MKTQQFSDRVLSDRETLLLLEGFCYEALRFLEVSPEQYPKFKIGVSMMSDGKADPLFVDYVNSRVLVHIPVIRMMLSTVTDNDSPTYFRMMGYQIARLWKRFILTGSQTPLKIFDEDSIIFAYALMLLKGIHPNDMMPNDKAIEMLKNEFNIHCNMVDAYNAENNKQQILQLTPSASEQKKRELEELYDENINRLLETLAEGELGSQSNPFANVDEAAEYILRIEKERLATDHYRQVVFNEQYFYDGVTFRIPWASSNVSYYPIEKAPLHAVLFHTTQFVGAIQESPAHNNYNLPYKEKCCHCTFGDDSIF